MSRVGGRNRWGGVSSGFAIGLAIPLLVSSQGVHSQSADGANAATTAPAVLDEVIVTAQKRFESAHDVPVAITSMDAAALQRTNLLGIERLAAIDPNVAIETAQSFQRNSIDIRGIGTIGNSRSFEGAVGVFIDGIYRPRAGMVLTDLLDIDKIEILRGPQGTLFGKNTSAGTISLMSAKPVLGTFEGDAEMRFGSYEQAYFSGALNIPTGDKGALRLAGTRRTRDGFFESPDNGAQYDTIDRYGFKVQYLVQPTDRLEVLVIGDYARSAANCCWSAAIAVAGPTAPLIDAYSRLNGLTFVRPPTAEQERQESLNSPSRETIEDEGITARVDWRRGAVTLTSITGIRSWSNAQVEADADFSPANLFVLGEPATIDSFSQEINATIPIGRTDLLLGYYYGEEDYDSLRAANNGPDADNYLNALVSASRGSVACLPPIIAVDCLFPTGIAALLPNGEFTKERYTQNSHHNALFAHASTTLSDKFTLGLGLRHSIDNKAGGVDNLFWYDSAIVRGVLAAAGIPDDGTPRNGLDLIGTVYSPSFHDDDRNETTTGMASLQYYATPDVMVYGGYNRGYKAGGINLFREGAITSTKYAPEFADSIEVGMKAGYWGGRARTNVAIFDARFSDLQINFFTGLEFRTENTGEATSRGIEIENNFQVSDALRVDFSLTHLNAEFADLIDPSLSYLDHRATPKSPSWAGVLSADYEKPLGNRLTLIARGLVSYTGKHFVGAEIPDEQEASAYSLISIDLGVRSRGGRWEALLWCTNCGDRSYRTVYFNTTFQPGSYSVYLGPPREYGVTLRARLGH